MSYVTEIARGTRTAKKPHVCYDCGREIAKGTEYAFFTGKYDHVYTLHMHADCTAASEFYVRAHRLHLGGTFDDGIPPLLEMVSEGGEFQADCDMLRGHFPHVVARFELSAQLAEMRSQARKAQAA